MATPLLADDRPAKRARQQMPKVVLHRDIGLSHHVSTDLRLHFPSSVPGEFEGNSHPRDGGIRLRTEICHGPHHGFCTGPECRVGGLGSTRSASTASLTPSRPTAA